MELNPLLESEDAAQLLYTDKKAIAVNNRLTQAIQQNMVVNDNPHIYLGFLESLPGEFKHKKPYRRNQVSNSYSVKDPKLDNEIWLYTIVGVNPQTMKMQTVMHSFKHFAILRDFLKTKFYGIYIPPLPPKSLMSLKTDTTKKERTLLLRTFI